jgi:VRR-NUC domain
MDERTFEKQVVDLAHMYGYRVAHFAAAMNARGNYRTPTRYDAKGFPDLVLVRNDFGDQPKRLIFAELKSDTGRLSKDQALWIDDLASTAEAYVWRPRDWDDIVDILR